jgi:hypothetical protein
MDLLLEVISKLSRRDAMLLCSDLCDKGAGSKENNTPRQIPFLPSCNVYVEIDSGKRKLARKIVNVNNMLF